VAQAPEPKPDSPAVRALIDRAKTVAGPMWADEVHFFCEAPRANSPTDPPIAPSRLFDDVYAIGNTGTTAYVIRTAAGLVMIDALGANQVEDVLLPGLAAVGLDPAQVKAIVVGHGHADHFGGSAYMQERYGTRYQAFLDVMAMCTDVNIARRQP
jgi:metallo-beta-lactamase class B